MSKLISRNNNIIKYKAPSQKIKPLIRLTDDDLMLMGWQRLYYDNDPNHRQVKDTDPLRKTLDLDNYDWWVGDLLGNLVPKEAVLNYWNTKNAPASNATSEKRWEDRASELDLLKVEKELQHRRNVQFGKDADTVFIKAPLTLLGLGIGGAALAPWLTSALATPTGQALMYGSLGGEALNFTSQLGDYDNFGHLIYNAGGGENWRSLPEWQKTLWNFTNPGYLISGPASKAINLTVEGLQQNALNNTFKGIPINPTTKDLAKAINAEVKNKQFSNLFPGQIGWAPRQTLTGYHASNKPIQEFNYWYPNWAVIEHNAPHGIYFTANETRPSGGFLAKRPYIEQVTSTFDKPMVLVGEISAAGKNATRNSIERQAQYMGADGIIYQGIKDNQLENQTIVKALNPDLKVNVSEIIENDPYLVTKILDKDKIRLRLPTHTKDLPREIVLEPQGNNQYRIHIRTWNGDHVPANLDSKEKQALFESVYNELPEGAEILFPESSTDYPATRGTVAALMRLSRDPRFLRGNTTGTLMYTDKNGNLQTFTGNSFIKRQKPIDSNLLGSAGKYGEFYPKIESDDIKWITDEFSNRYETTPLTLYTTPILEQISDDAIALGIGEFGLSNTTKAFTDIMKRRWNLYNYKFNDNDITPIPDSNFLSYIQGDGNRTFHTVDWIFDNIKNKKQILYTPTTDHSWGGFHKRDNDSNWIRWNPRINHIPTTIHETISHGTDPIVRNFVTNTGQPVLGKSTVSTLQWNPETGNFETIPMEMPSLYELLSYPIDVFNPGKIADTITEDAVNDYEARASNWEMIANLYNRIAKERGITPQEAFQIPDSEFHNYVDNLSNEDIVDLLRTTNGYTMKYAKLFDTDDQYAVNNYLRLWRQALKYAPSLIPVGLSKTNQSRSNRKGGKLIKRK